VHGNRNHRRDPNPQASLRELRLKGGPNQASNAIHACEKMLRLRPSISKDGLHNILESSRLFAMLKYIDVSVQTFEPLWHHTAETKFLFFPEGAASLYEILEALLLSYKPMSQTIQRQFQCHNFDRHQR